MNDQGQITLPDVIRAAAHVEPDTEFTVEAAADGSIVLRPRREPDQWWFWTEEWQAGERQADADLAAGRFTRYEGDETFLRSLHPTGDATQRRTSGGGIPDADLR